MITIPQFYVYVLARPNGKPFYVGKGHGRRIHDHEMEARSGHRCHKCNAIRKIWKQGGEVQRYIVFTTDNEQEAYDYEEQMIALHGRANLCNHTDGGKSGGDLSVEAKAKLSKALKTRYAIPEVRAWHLEQLKIARAARKQKALDKRTNGDFCTVEGCDHKLDAAGLCRGHLGQRTVARKRGVEWKPKTLKDQKTNTVDICIVAECGRKVDTRNLCRSHYEYYLKAKREGVAWEPKPILVRRPMQRRPRSGA